MRGRNPSVSVTECHSSDDSQREPSVAALVTLKPEDIQLACKPTYLKLIGLIHWTLYPQKW